MFANTAIILCGTTLFFTSIFAIIFGYLAYNRWLTHKEMLLFAEKGILPPNTNDWHARKNESPASIKSRNSGIFTAAIGLALCIGLYPLGWRSGFFLGIGPWMLGGLIPLFIGLTKILIWVLGQQESKALPAPQNTHNASQPPSTLEEG